MQGLNEYPAKRIARYICFDECDQVSVRDDRGLRVEVREKGESYPCRVETFAELLGVVAHGAGRGSSI